MLHLGSRQKCWSLMGGTSERALTFPSPFSLSTNIADLTNKVRMLEISSLKIRLRSTREFLLLFSLIPMLQCCYSKPGPLLQYDCNWKQLALLTQRNKNHLTHSTHTTHTTDSTEQNSHIPFNSYNSRILSEGTHAPRPHLFKHKLLVHMNDIWTMSLVLFDWWFGNGLFVKT